MTEETEAEMDGFKKLCRQHAEVAAVELNQGPKTLAMDRQINIIQKELETAVQKFFGFESLQDQITDLQTGLAQLLESKEKMVTHLASKMLDMLSENSILLEAGDRLNNVIVQTMADKAVGNSRHPLPHHWEAIKEAHGKFNPILQQAKTAAWEAFKAVRDSKPKSHRVCHNCTIQLTVEEVERVGSSATDDDMTCEMCDLQMYGGD